jgi:UDP-N-acetylglucosamine 3-dehydrogenase
MLKVGVIGVGSMGKNHARVCSEIEDIKLIGVSDVDKEVSKNIANRLGTKSYSDYKELISEIDAAIVASPTNTHYDIALNLLENGKHVLVEKPICDKIKKADSLLTYSEDQDLVLAVGHIERHNPAVKFVKENLEANKFGDLITITSKRVSDFPVRIKDVGVIFDFGVHDIDVMRYLSGEVVSVYAKAGKFKDNIDFEDHANIILNFENGITGVIEVNWLTPIKIRKLFLTCSKNFVEADYISQSLTISSSSFKDIDEMNLFKTRIQYNIDKVSIEKKEPLKNEIEDFVSAINNHKKPLVTAKDGLMALKIAEASTKSYLEGREIEII